MYRIGAKFVKGKGYGCGVGNMGNFGNKNCLLASGSALAKALTISEGICVAVREQHHMAHTPKPFHKHHETDRLCTAEQDGRKSQGAYSKCGRE